MFISETRGPVHIFRGHKSEFYITQDGCSKGSAEVDAAYFCKSFYGCEYTPTTSYQEGSYSQTRLMGWQLHKNKGCRAGKGLDIDGSDCDGYDCKIWKTNEDHQGLYNIRCEVTSGNVFFTF